MENKNEMTPQELLAKLKESIKNDPAPENEASTAQEISELSDDEIIRSYEEAQKEKSAPSVVYHFSVRRKEAAPAPEEPVAQDEEAEEPTDGMIPPSDIEIETPAVEASAPVDMMKDFMSDDEIADMQRFAAMPGADEIAQKAKQLASEAEEGNEEEVLSLSDEIELDYIELEEDDNTSDAVSADDEIKMNITPDEASKRNAMDFISSLTKKAASNAADAATVAGEAAIGAASATAEAANDAAGAVEQSVEEFDDVDVNLMIAFGMEDRLKETVGAEEAQKIAKQADNEAKNFTNTDIFKTVNEEEKPVTEFTDNSQIKTIFAAYKTRYRKLIMKIGASVLITLFLFFFENLSFIGVTLPGALNPGFYPIVNIMVGLQMLVFSCALVWDGIKRSVNALLAKKPIPESATALMLIFALIYQLLTLAFARDNINTFNLPVSFAVLFTLIGEFLSLKREIFSFNIAASKKVKYTLESVSEDDCIEERETFSYFFGDDLTDEAEETDLSKSEILEGEEPGEIVEEATESEKDESRPVYKMKKGAFIDGFFERMNRYPSYKAVLGFIIPVFAIVSVLFFILGFVRTGDITGAIRMGYIALVMCTPAAMFISFDYPAYKASKNAFENESAIIGEAAAEEYLDAAIMTFEDKDIFPSRGVKVKSIKVYGSHRIDRVVFNAANIFRKYGGPLSSVFNKATLELGTTDEVFFGTVEDDGIEAMVSGSHIYLGTTDYLRRKSYEPVIDDEDEVVEGNGGICIMFMAIEDEIAAKFYVEYTLDAEFENILRALYSSGICIAVRTYDPNISDRMLNLLLRYEQYPVKVIKTRSEDNVNIAKEHAQSGVVSRRSVKDMLRAFMSCDKVLRAIKSATALKIASMAVALIVLFIVLMFGAGAGVASVYAVLYQLFWMIPLFIIVRFLI